MHGHDPYTPYIAGDRDEVTHLLKVFWRALFTPAVLPMAALPGTGYARETPGAKLACRFSNVATFRGYVMGLVW